MSYPERTARALHGLPFQATDYQIRFARFDLPTGTMLCRELVESERKIIAHLSVLLDAFEQEAA